MLKDIIKSTGLDSDVCADLLGINPSFMREWILGQRPIPAHLLPRLATVFGVPISDLVSSRAASDAPAVWYKLRDSRLVESDRESVMLIRNLGFFLAQLDRVTSTTNVLWKAFFEQIRKVVDKQSSPTEQGRVAAQVFRASRALHQGATGVGSVIRDNLRNTGLLIIESPLPDSAVEGCSFYVGQPGSEIPCLFANSYGSTWFRRNLVLMHELGHALFDLDSEAVSLDYKGENDYQELQERRAEAFAREMLVPIDVLLRIQTRFGLKWDHLTANDLANIVASTHVEAGTILKVAEDAGLIDRELRVQYESFRISEDLKRLTPHALETKEFLSQIIDGTSVWPANKRTTTVSSRRLRLPVSYVAKVLRAVQSENISIGKAAEMLMMDKETVLERFPENFAGVR